MESPEIKAFLKDVRRMCRENGIKLILSPTVQIEAAPGIKCVGYLDDGEMVLKVAKKSPLFLGVLVHEFCHAEQMLENTIEWQRDSEFGNAAFDEWIQGKEIKNIRRAINNLLALELDCERRALKKIAQYDLPINSSTYIQRANECLLFYRWVELTRRWDNSNTSDIWHKMPARFMSDSYYKKLTPKMEKIFLMSGI